MENIAITAATRTAIGAFNGTLAATPAHDLGAHVIKAALEKSKLQPNDVDQVLMGQVLTAGQGQNPARQAQIKSGVPQERTAMTINQVCGSGLRAVMLGAGLIQLGQANIIVAGGQENMSLSQHALHLRNGVKFGDAAMKDTMIVDGLWEAFNNYHMGITAENIAEAFKIDRNTQDAYAAQSQQRAEAAIKGGKFKDEITPFVIKNKKGDVTFDTDEFPRAGTTVESLGALKPAFKPDGTVTAGNASGLNDGSAAMLIASTEAVKKYDLKPLAKIITSAVVGVEPRIMGTGPVFASRKALEKAGLTLDQMDIIEINEAFAVQVLACLRELGIADDDPRVNPNGGAISLGHPLGMSGTRILHTAALELQRQEKRYALVTMCVGVGQGYAVIIENVINK